MSRPRIRLTRRLLVGAVAGYSNNRGGEPSLEVLQNLLARASDSPPKSDATNLLPRRLSRRLDPEIVREIVAKYDAGATSHELRAEYSLAQGSILKLLAKNGARLRKQGLTNEEVARAVALYESGVAIEPIAQELDSSYNTVRSALLRAGVTMRPRLRTVG